MNDNVIKIDFSSDVDDPASYDFVCTGEYLKSIDKAGTKIFYRLGVSIEHHAKKHNTAPLPIISSGLRSASIH